MYPRFGIFVVIEALMMRGSISWITDLIATQVSDSVEML
jgi:hypothetical protein